MRAEGWRMKAEGWEPTAELEPPFSATEEFQEKLFSLHPSSFRLHPFLKQLRRSCLWRQSVRQPGRSASPEREFSAASLRRAMELRYRPYRSKFQGSARPSGRNRLPSSTI